MRRFGLIVVAGLIGAAALPGGCSCEDSQATAPGNHVVRVEEAEEHQQAQPRQAAEQQEAGPQPERRRRVGESVLQAPADYLRTTTITAPRAAKRKINAAYIQSEIKQWWAMKGRYPKSLAEFEDWRGSELPECPTGYQYDYDASTGKLEVVRKR